ncbi:MAG: ABC transporter permease [Firmicutes bacterium]|nr:ABC transporter permease [Bacillota bacterium]
MGFVSEGMDVVFLKELADHLTSKRFLILVLLMAVTGFSSIYAASRGITKGGSGEEIDLVFLRLFTNSGNSLPSFAAFISFLCPLMGLALGFDGINGERARGTLSKLLGQPIHRDAVINGKFFAGLTVMAFMIVSLGLIVAGLGLVMLGVPPSLEELTRILVFLMLTIVYVGFWLGLSLLFSLLFRQTATSALAGIAVWLFFTVFLGLLAGIAADVIVPVANDASQSVFLRNWIWRQNLSRFSPATLYWESITTILTPEIRTLGPIFLEQIEGAVPGALPLGQSLLLIWPHLTGLVAATLLCFAASYVVFMRQEIRA